MESVLNKKFKHHKWFLEGVTVAYALDYFAKCGDFYIGKKPARKQSDNLFDDMVYEEVLMCYGDRSTYKLNEVEKRYFLERKEYWNKKRREEQEEWENAEIDFNERIKNYFIGKSYYDVDHAIRQKEYALERNDSSSVDFWQKEIDKRNKSKRIVDELVRMNRSFIKTNGDFRVFEEKISEAIRDVK